MKLQKHHYGVLTVTLLLLGVLVGYSLLQNNMVPVAWVNGDLIWLGEVQENTTVSQQLFRNAPELAAADPDLSGVLSRAEYGTLFGRALESSIVNTILRTSVSREVRKEAERLSTQSLRELNSRELEALMSAEYGWDLATFRERIIEPQMLRQVLVDRHGDGFRAWVQGAKEDAAVHVWFVPFEWEQGALVEKVE